MAIHKSVQSLNQRQQRRFDDVIKLAQKLHEEHAELSKDDFKKDVFGRKSRADGSHFIQSRGTGLTKRELPIPINIRTGELKDSVFLEGPKGRLLEFFIGASADYAKYVLPERSKIWGRVELKAIKRIQILFEKIIALSEKS